MPLVVFVLSAALVSGQTPAPAASSARISGRVLAEGANTPLAGARVMLLPVRPAAGPNNPPLQKVTDQDGRYVFENLAPGRYSIQAEHAGFAQRIDFTTMPTWDVAAGQTLDNVDIALPRSGAIAGRILDPSGGPLAEAHVMVIRRVKRPGMEPRLVPAPGQGQQTNDLGEFRVYGLAPGTYYVAAGVRPASFGAVSAPPAATTSSTNTTATTFYPGTTDQASAQPVAVTPGETVANISFTMQSAPAFRVSGVVVDDSGSPVGGALVMLMGDQRSGIGMFMGSAGNARTEDNGRFVIGDVTPGNYRVMASVPMMSGASGGGSFSSWSTSSGAVGGVSSGVVVSAEGPGVAGGVSGGVAVSNGGMQMAPPTEVAVTDADVKGLRVVVHR